jgi:hypothetical protein
MEERVGDYFRLRICLAVLLLILFQVYPEPKFVLAISFTLRRERAAPPGPDTKECWPLLQSNCNFFLIGFGDEGALRRAAECADPDIPIMLLCSFNRESRSIS